MVEKFEKKFLGTWWVKGFVFFYKKVVFFIVICFTSSQTFCKMSIFFVKSVAATGWSRLEPAGADRSWILIGAHFSSLEAVSSEPFISCMELDTGREGRSSFQQRGNGKSKS